MCMRFEKFNGLLGGMNSPWLRKDMYLRYVGRGQTVSTELTSYATNKVEWVSQETDAEGKPVAVREPKEVTRECSKSAPFVLAGKIYQNLNGFLRKQDGEWCEDIYGRQVLCTKTKFPCFDSYDFMYESRYYRWYFIRRGNAVSLLFTADDRDRIYVTEDVQNVEDWSWQRMKATGFCQMPAQENADHA